MGNVYLPNANFISQVEFYLSCNNAIMFLCLHLKSTYHYIESNSILPKTHVVTRNIYNLVDMNMIDYIGFTM